MYALVGLGNPGREYENTRHNVGFLFIDYFGQQKNIINLKPDTFMNNSGEAVKKLLNYYKISPENLYVVHDDLDLRLGEFKIQKGKGPKLHNGINSIEEHIATSDFWRVRIGVDNRDPDNRMSGESYVLEKFSTEELKKITQIFEEVKKELEDHIL